ncbi:hypothetical protein OEA41_008291 [Lepraria neglecta]|uniref:GPI inositol-deacylase n=1 Tax=Lepraria neglecta TaxID=209136 RepID=A0AAD9ZH63_9LECA|nr:hypothetical protein OEA41_008291 [Lepraria neglecta]
MFLRHRTKTSSRSRNSLLESSLRGLSVRGIDLGGEVEDFKGPTGLSLLFEPSEPLVDLIFVHGLRGGSRKTWSKTNDPYHYWPKEWLPRDPEFKNVRIHSFGYNSDWGETKQSFLDIHDFGKSLLVAIYDSPHIRAAGDTPLILVGHSMGGLVSKKAYVLARQDSAFQALAQRFYGIVFLATPHRGSDSAQQLSNLLRASLPHGSKPYVGDLERGSGTLKSINDEFRHYSDSLQLRSFYETLKTAIGMNSVLIVDQASATLGYQNEKSALINASHRDICKFETPWDPNFIIVRNALLSYVDDITKWLMVARHEEHRSQMRALESYLGVSERPEDELAALEDIRFGGSCLWFSSKQNFQNWRDDFHGSAKTFWLSGKPATGKSVLAGNVIGELEDLNLDCSYYFFRHNDTAKSNLASCLKSIAFQMAIINIKVRQMLLRLKEDDVQIDKTDERTIWRKLFVNGIFQIEASTRPHFWIIDALDECNNHALLFPMLAKVETPFPLKIFITSRHSSDFTKHFAILGSTVIGEQISTDDTLQDIRLYVHEKVESLPLNEEAFRHNVVDTVVKKSSGCFLWVALVLEELGKVYTEADIEQVLEEVPPDMDALYQRALDAMSNKIRNKQLVQGILTWVMCAARPMSIPELSYALKIDLGVTVNALEGPITSDCGQLLFIDKANKVQIVHQTIRDFLFKPGLTSEFGIKKAAGHGRLFETCLKYLTSEEMRPPRNYQLTKLATRLSKRSTFEGYACLSFNEHLRRVHSAEDRYLMLLDTFLTSNVLSWIEYLAKTGELHHITGTAKALRGYLEARAKYCSPIGKQVQRVDTWATDLIRLVAKFGKNLLELPTAIYWLIPPFCPRESAIGSQFGASPRGIAVQGPANNEWDDRLACISYNEQQATAIAFIDTMFVVALSNKTLRIYNKATLQELKRLYHVEPAKLLAFDSKGRVLACSGRKHVRVWNMATGDIMSTFVVQHEPLALRFGEKDTILMAITRGNVTCSWNLSEGTIKTPRIRQNSFEGEDSSFRRPLTAAAFSLELNMSAVVYRGRPVCLFDLNEDILLGTCNKEQSSGDELQEMDDAMVTPAIGLVFNPKSDISLLAATYIDGDLALFDPCELSLIAVVEAGAQALACSPDGRTLATGDSIGNIQLFEFETLRLMYRIRADEYQIKGLAFSHDGLRFCDVRGPQCNVWEPSVLVRTEVGESDSVSDMIPSAPKTVDIADQDDISEITTMVCHPAEHFVFYGNDRGLILALDTSTARQTQVLWKHAKNVPISALVWVPAQTLLISADASSRILAYELDYKAQRWEVTGPVLDTHLEHSINHLTLNAQKDIVLISSSMPGNKSQGDRSHSTEQAEQISSLNLESFALASPNTNTSQDNLAPHSDIKLLPEFVQHIVGKTGSKLIFLDKSLWVCSMVVNGSKQRYLRHFFIPDDWLNASQILLSKITLQGDCVFARKDAVVVIKRGLRYEEVISAG